MFEYNGNGGDLDRHSEPEEASPQYGQTPDRFSNVKIYEGRPYRDLTMEPVPRGSPNNVKVYEGRPYRVHTMQPVPRGSPNNVKVYEGRPYRVHTMQPVPRGSPYSLYSLEPVKYPQSPEEGHSSHKFTRILANSSMERSNEDDFLSNDVNPDYEEDMHDRVESEKWKDSGEIKVEKFQNDKLVSEAPDAGKPGYRDSGGNNDSAMGHISFEFSDSSDSEEEELIIIDSDTDHDSDEVTDSTQTKYCEYPVGKSNTVTVSEKDYRSLEYSKFLNDIIIDFYLNFIFLHRLPVEHQSSVHVFSTIFYKRLLQVPSKKRKSANFEEDPDISIAEKRHRRVSGWTKTLDLFSKSVIVFPICEDSHWYLLIVVGLSGETTTSPFILVLDSLGGERKRAVRIIRKYLASEYQAKKMEGKRGFSDVDIPSIRPVKPLQPNGTDCGVYLLHYAEKIFESISQFLSPELPCLKNWFSHEEVEKKREEIAYLIKILAKKQKPNEVIEFPNIPFTSKKGGDVDQDEVMELSVEEVKHGDDSKNRLDNITHQSSVGTSEMVGSENVEMRKDSSCKKRTVQNKNENGVSSRIFKKSLKSTWSSRGITTEIIGSEDIEMNRKSSLEKPAVPENPENGPGSIIFRKSLLSTLASRGIPRKNLESKSKPLVNNYCKSYSSGLKIPRMKKSDCTKTQSAVYPTETNQTSQRSLPSNVSKELGTDSINRKLVVDKLLGPKFHTAPQSYKLQIVKGTASSCPIYGDRCEGLYHLHPKVKNVSRTNRNGVDYAEAPLRIQGNREVVSSINRPGGKYREIKKSDIVDKIWTGAREKSSVRDGVKF